MWSGFGMIGVLFLRYWRYLLCFFLGFGVTVTCAWKLWPSPSVLPQQTSCKPLAQPVIQEKTNAVAKSKAKIRVMPSARPVAKPSSDRVPDSPATDSTVEIEIENTTEATYDKWEQPTQKQPVVDTRAGLSVFAGVSTNLNYTIGVEKELNRYLNVGVGVTANKKEINGVVITLRVAL